MGLLSDISPIAGAAIDAIGSVGGGLFSANQAKKNRAFQQRMYEQQVRDNRENWRMQVEYADPKNELARIVNAGLNPLLMYGQNGIMSTVSTPSGGSLPSGSAAHGQFQTNFGQAMAQSLLLRAQIQNIDADTNLKNSTAAESESRTIGNEFQNWLNDNSRNVLLALRYRDYDYVNSAIDKNRNEVFQSSFRNAAEIGSLSLMNSLAIRRQNLSEYEVGQNILQGWQAVISGRISANAQVKSAFAAMMNATTAAKLAPAQIGLMRAQASNYREQTAFLKQSRPYRVNQEFQRAALLRKDVTWYDVLRESGISEQQSRTFLNVINSEYTNTLNEYKPIDEFMTPVNMLTGFGAGMLLKGNFGRTVVSGFGR